MANHKLTIASAWEIQAQENLVQTNVLEAITGIFIRAREIADKKELVSLRLTMLNQRYLEIVLLLHEGRVSAADVAILSSSIEATRSDSLELEIINYELTVRLGQLIGINVSVQPDFSAIRTVTNNLLKKEDLLPDKEKITINTVGPEVRKAKFQVTRTEALKSLASRSFLPEISGFALYNYRSGSDWDPVGEWAAGISLKLPIFEGGKRFANRQAAKASVKAAQEVLKSAQQEQNASLKIAFEQWQITQKRHVLLSKAVSNKSKSVAAQREMFDEGRISMSELLTQETELLQFQLQEREMIYKELQAILHYHTVAGTLNKNNVLKIVGSAQ